jgi:hypothetical protein
VSTGGGGIDGRGCRRWDASCTTRFPPAESPPMTIFAGEIPLFRRCDSAALACLNWVGKGESGIRAKCEYVRRLWSDMGARIGKLTVFQHGNANVTEGGRYVFLKGAQEFTIVRPCIKAEASSCRQTILEFTKSVNLRKMRRSHEIQFTVEVEENSVLSCIPSWSNPMQLCPLCEEIGQDFLFISCPVLVHHGCGNTVKRAQGMYFPFVF